MKVLIAAGGTGGHIYPALALGEALKREYPDTSFDFVCGERDVEQRIYAENAIKPIVLPARTIGKGMVGKATGAISAAANTWRAAKLIRRGRYDAVIGMGGYSAGPTVLAGVILRRRTGVHESNSVLGKANRWVARFVDFCAVNFPVTEDAAGKRAVVVGMPIRSDVLTGSREDAMAAFGLDPQKRTLLVTGGSQGARRLYDLLVAAIPLLDQQTHTGVQVLWSTGHANYDELQRAVATLAPRFVSLKLRPFLDMKLALAAADVALSRAGASTIAEFGSLGIPSLYVPLPIAIYDHQALNAAEVVKVGLGRMVREHELTPQRLAKKVHELLKGITPGQRQPIPPQLDSRTAASKLAALVAGKAKP